MSDECELVSVSPNPWRSGGAKLTPLGKSGGTVGLEVLSTVEAELLVEVVMDRGVDGYEFLQTSHPPEPQHRPLSSSKRQMRIVSAVVGPTRHLAVIASAHILQGRAIES